MIDTRNLDPNLFDKYIKVFDRPAQLIAVAVELATADAAPAALNAARQTPRPAVHPFKWSNDPSANQRARRWYFAAIKRGEIRTDGERYIRSGEFGRSFDVGVQESANGIDAVFGSNFEASSYVVGNQDGSISQIPGHERTGWYEFRNPADAFTDDVVAGVTRELGDVIEKGFE